jgi:Copper type II ascorbate-dependent monooxygenase, C-terminal domain.
MQKPFTVPADGTVPYVYISIPTNLKQDIWIRAVELKPTDRRVVHHIISNLVEGDGHGAGSGAEADARSEAQGNRRRPRRPGAGTALRRVRRRRRAQDSRGTDIVLQMHYTTIGQVVTDQTEIGVVLAKEPPAKLRAEGGGSIPNTTFAIPPGDPNYEVTGKLTFNRDTYLSSLYPHMHVRGKDATYTVVYPDGREEVVLRVPKYDFNWQLSYKLAEPKFLPKGSTLKVRCTTTTRPRTASTRSDGTVRWGDQTWEEMMLGYYGTIELPGSTATRTRQR